MVVEVKASNLLGLCIYVAIFLFSELPTTALFKFVDEGDNSIDAVALVNYLNSWKNFIQV